MLLINYSISEQCVAKFIFKPYQNTAGNNDTNDNIVLSYCKNWYGLAAVTGFRTERGRARVRIINKKKMFSTRLLMMTRVWYTKKKTNVRVNSNLSSIPRGLLTVRSSILLIVVARTRRPLSIIFNNFTVTRAR